MNLDNLSLYIKILIVVLAIITLKSLRQLSFTVENLKILEILGAPLSQLIQDFMLAGAEAVAFAVVAQWFVGVVGFNGYHGCFWLRSNLIALFGDELAVKVGV